MISSMSHHNLLLADRKLPIRIIANRGNKPVSSGNLLFEFSVTLLDCHALNGIFACPKPGILTSARNIRNRR